MIIFVAFDNSYGLRIFKDMPDRVCWGNDVYEWTGYPLDTPLDVNVLKQIKALEEVKSLSWEIEPLKIEITYTIKVIK